MSQIVYFGYIAVMRFKILQRISAMGFFLIWAEGLTCSYAGSAGLYRYIQSQPAMNWAFSIQEESSSCMISILQPEFELQKKDEGTMMTLPGVSAWTKPGEPRLPVFVALFELEVGAGYSVKVEPGEPRDFDAGYLEPEPTVRSVSTDDNVYEVVTEKTADTAIYQQDVFWPTSYYTVDEAKGAGRRYLRVGIHTFRYNPISQMLRQYPDMRLVINFTAKEPTGP